MFFKEAMVTNYKSHLIVTFIVFLLPDQDSNLDKQNQNLLYYHYTIRQLIEYKFKAII